MSGYIQKALQKLALSEDQLQSKKCVALLQLLDKVYQEGEEERQLLENQLLALSEEMRELKNALREKAEVILGQEQEKYRELARRDSLTGLLNRHAFEEEMEILIERSKRSKRSFALLFLDLDYFKNINDTYGHDMGDRLLQQVTNRIKSHLRKGDIFARLGGDEFVIVFTDVKEKCALTATVQKIHKLFAKPFVIEGHEFLMSASLGIVRFPDDATDLPTLLKHADTAMYRTKESGKNGFSFYTKSLNAEIAFKLQLTQHMKEGLESGEFELYYQPKIEIASGKIIGAEALVRWNHPDFGLLNPNTFIPLMESDGFIKKLGKWVIEESCHFIEQQNKLFPNNDLHISVNISMQQLNSELAKIIRNATQQISPEQLILEVTEGVTNGTNIITNQTLNELKAMQVHIAIDDFGVGRFSLSRLQQLPIDSLKIDKSFINDIPRKKGEQSALINAIISLAKIFDLTVTAEGVEEEFQMEYLRSLKCDFFQGYLFNRPLPATHYLQLLKKHHYRDTVPTMLSDMF